MRILLNAVAAKMGGAANYIRALARELVPAKQHEFLFLVPSSQASSIEGLAPHVRVITNDVAEQPFPHRLWFDQVELPRLIQRERINVLFSTANFATFFCPCRQILLVRNSVYFSPLYRSKILPSKHWKTRITETMRRWLACQSIAVSDVVMTPSQAILDEIRAVANVGEAVVNHYGVDERRFQPKTTALAESGPVSLVFTSLYAEHKNLGTLFRALLELKASNYEYKLITTADPGWEQIDNPIRQSDCELAEELKRTGLLELTGVLDRPGLDRLYRQGDIFVYPSVVESFGHPLLEAMASGLPVVAADVPINRELCADAALYFSPFDPHDCAQQISALIKDAYRREVLGQRGLERANQFQWASHAQRLIQQFANCEKVVASPIVSPA